MRNEITAKLMVGLEVHVELATRTKMWTAAPNLAHADHFDAAPNTLLDPVVIGMPGTLPVMNREAVEMSMKVGLALGCQIARRCKWDRKSYYYPDLPKNYQISQYDLPLCYDGALSIPVFGDDPRVTEHDEPHEKKIGIIRAHLEEDAGKLLHESPGGGVIDHSIVDLNRAGTPLLEIVTQPDFESADEVVAFCVALRDICRHLRVSEGDMQRGHMRFEPNINVIIEHRGKVYKTPIVEIKNLNSFKAVAGAIEYEYERQIDEWIDTGRVMAAREKSTRGWDDAKGVTVLQREKEDEDEYRYFPDPDLLMLEVDEAWLERVKSEMPMLPLGLRHWFIHELGLDGKQADQLLTDPDTTDFYLLIVNLGPQADPRRAAAMLLNLGAKRANEHGCGIHELGITADQIVGILQLLEQDKISSNGADELFGHACDSDADAAALAEQHGLLQVSDDSQLDAWIDEVLADPKNDKAINDLKAGKDKAIGALLGQIMKLSKGQANPKLVGERIKTRIKG